MELLLEIPPLYRVKEGQTLLQIARVFSLPPCLIARKNGLSCEVEAGQVLLLPQGGGNRYRVHGGESRSLLCGSPSQFEEKNGTSCLYPGQEVYL